MKYVHNKEEKAFKCSICIKSFAKPNDLNDHIRYRHEYIKSHKCNQCDKLFGYKGTLSYHKKTVHHLKNFGFKCRYCDKSLFTLTNLRRHIAVSHEQILAYKCTLCSKRFGYLNNLTQHLRNQNCQKK